MSKQDGSFQNAANTNKDDVSGLMNPIKVLVVHHKNNLVAYVGDLLHSTFFEVTCVDHSIEAIRLLSEKKSDYDLILITHDIRDMDIHTFLRQTKDKDVLPIVMSDQEDDAFILEVFKSGAFLVLKTPLTKDALRRMRQDVIRKRMHEQGKRDNKVMNLKIVAPEMDIEKRFGSKWKDGGEQMKEVDQSTLDSNPLSESSSDNGNDGLKKRKWMEWTPTLCETFDKARTQLGEGRCHPTEIHKLMNVPGLTKRQVASHLQKFRNKMKKSKENHIASASLANQDFPSNLPTQGINERKYGTMPHVETYEDDKEGGIDFNGINRYGAKVNNMLNLQTDIDSSLIYKSSKKNISQDAQNYPFTCENGTNHGTRITATIDFLQAKSGIQDPGQGVNHRLYMPSESHAYDDFLIYLDGSGLNQDLISESFQFSHDHNK
ncbi:hypothetical protein R6Q59_007276, partial [Mikania micrantha]